ncbi:MAG: methyltransferase type 11 [Betaproteobacteria bacterium]|nr:methyltransferase type 11 [Betaproteobacteria bacterium]
MDVSTNNILSEFLNAYWLRPETALWRTVDVNAMADFQFESPSLDVGCGDGMFSFVRAGGQLDKTFDAFQATTNLDKFFENVDVFDAFDPSSSPLVMRKPNYQIDCGFDHKENLLRKAAALGLYKSVKQGDADSVFPFSDGTFNTVFSNIVYWLTDPGKAIAEISRVLAPGGKACLMLPSTKLPEFSFYNQLYVKTKDERWRFLERMDRGRFTDNIRQAKSSEQWEKYFTAAGLEVDKHTNHLSGTLVKIWDVGMRPLFPVLMRMTRAIAQSELAEIKQEWIDTLKHFLLPIAELDANLSSGGQAGFHCYILRKPLR